MTTTATPQPKPKKLDKSMDGVAEYLKAGPMTLLRLLSQVFRHPGPTQADALSLSRVLSEDPRFTICSVDNAYGAMLTEATPAVAPAPVEQPKSIQDMVDADAKLAADVAALHAASPKLPPGPVPASVAQPYERKAEALQPAASVIPPTKAEEPPRTEQEDAALDALVDALKGGEPAPIVAPSIDHLWSPETLARDYNPAEDELCASEFYKATGMIAPHVATNDGKHTPDERVKKYTAWWNDNAARVAAFASAAPLAVGTPVEQAAAVAPVVAIAADATLASMQAEIDRLRGEVIRARHDADAYREKISNQHDAAAKVSALEAKLEAAKATVGGIKLELAAANTALASLVLGDAQQTHPALKAPTPPTDEDDDQDDEDDDDEQPTKPAKAKKEPKPKPEKKPKAAKPPKVPTSTEPALPWHYGVKPDQIAAADSLPNDQKITQAQLRAALVEHIPQGVEVAKLKPKQVLTVKGIPHLARQANDTGTRWFMQVLYSQPEWNGSGLGDTFGRPVEGLDEHAEGKANREKGGPDCGRMIKVGAKLYVLTPESLGTVLTFEQGDRAALPVGVTPAAAIADAMATHSLADGVPEKQPDAPAPASSTPAAPVAGVTVEAGEDLPPE